MKQALLFAALCVLIVSCGQPHTQSAKLTVSKLDKKAIPASIKYDGVVDTAVKYSDADGDHIVFTTEYDDTEPGDDNEDRINGIHLQGYCYKLNGDKCQREWQMNDLVTKCEVDLAADFVNNTFAVTDLDNNGRGEVWLMYHMACRGDVSPSSIKIIMHEGAKKYALRGESRVKVNATDYYGGTYKLDEAFQKGPAQFRQHALQLWDKHHNEDFGEQNPNGIIN
jgi:hypothetical protein